MSSLHPGQDGNGCLSEEVVDDLENLRYRAAVGKAAQYQTPDAFQTTGKLLSPEEAITAGVAVGACNVEAADALSGICSWDETWQRVRSGWARHELPLNTPGWVLDEQQQLWVGPA